MINHILLSCVLARDVWTIVLQRLNHVVRPPDHDSRLNSWWYRAASSLAKVMKKGFNSLVILVSLGAVEAQECLHFLECQAECAVGNSGYSYRRALVVFDGGKSPPGFSPKGWLL